MVGNSKFVLLTLPNHTTATQLTLAASYNKNNLIETYSFMSEIVTRNYKYKTNLKRRIFATIIDYGIYFVFFYFYVDFFGHTNDSGGKTVEGWLALALPLFWFIYFVVVEAYSGATLGHHNLNLLVITTTRNKIGFEEAIKRHLLDFIDIYFLGIPAIIAIRNTDKHQRIGDLWANTIVVDVRDFDQYEESNQENTVAEITSR